MAKQLTAFRFSPEMIEVLNELTRKKRLAQIPGAKNKTEWLEHILAQVLRQSLLNQLSKAQLEFCRKPDDIFRLFVMYCKALRNVEGYGFTAKDPSKRYVYGPKNE